MGPYVVVACFRAWLVIEVDGSQHAEPDGPDERRTAWLASHGFRVLRFWNTNVLQRTEAVLESIRAASLEPPPFGSPS